MITVLARVKIRKCGSKMYLRKRLMPNGCRSIPNCVPGVRRQSKEVPAVTLWPVYVARDFVISVQDPGNLIIRIILSAIFIRRVQISMLIGKRKFWKK